MTSTKLVWIKIRYRTKRGAKQNVTVIQEWVEHTIADLTKSGCHSFSREVK